MAGENGAGKTTFFRSIMQFLPKQTGKVQILGRTLERKSDQRWARSQIGYVPQTQGQGQFPISVSSCFCFVRGNYEYH
ncbi:ATP-binding cassette domain-containing protein [Paenibacillus sp. 2RAB27]|uniref:ATP-binding cassette domain-containing protein n=1 Tax=Paenibacillus sp. 2RAB27 TaxID=3232991 RepID=UPI003F97E3A8